MSRHATERWNGDKLAALVAGAIESAVNDHGPIVTRSQISSATKRVVGQIRGQHIDYERSADEQLERKYRRLKYGHERLIDQFERVRAERDELRARVCVEGSA